MPGRLVPATLLAILTALPVAHAEETPREIVVPTAPVEIDGRVVFSVRGVAAYSAEERAAAIAARIVAIAEDSANDPALIEVIQLPSSSDVTLNRRLIVSVTDADAAVYAIGRHPLALAYGERTKGTITNYRNERHAGYLEQAAASAAIGTAVLAVTVWLVLWLTRRMLVIAERRSRRFARSIETLSYRVLQAERIWHLVRGLLGTARYLIVAVLVYCYAEYALSRFPWTRHIAGHLFDLVIDPLSSFWYACVAKLPDLIALVLIVAIVRYLIRLMRLFFESVGRGSVQLRNFEKEWAAPTYRIARYIVLIFTAVVAYPYIPGSGSEAFKGVTLLTGVMLSIGSTSFISNLIAGYALTYRRVFKVGEWVQINDTIGQIVHMRLMVTHLRSFKNEEITLPNSVILNSKVVNYSSMIRDRGLILHTLVGIGYEVPWRQVEAMLVLAAQRTHGMLREPPPFVEQRALGDFAITYELNAYCDNPGGMEQLYSALHRNIVDVFNEYGVQIMTPAYERDPREPKIVSKEHWFAAPAAVERPPAERARTAPPSTS